MYTVTQQDGNFQTAAALQQWVKFNKITLIPLLLEDMNILTSGLVGVLQNVSTVHVCWMKIFSLMQEQTIIRGCQATNTVLTHGFL